MQLKRRRRGRITCGTIRRKTLLQISSRPSLIKPCPLSGRLGLFVEYGTRPERGQPREEFMGISQHTDTISWSPWSAKILQCRSLLGLSQSHELIERQSGTSRSHNVLSPDAQVAPVPGVEVEPVATIEPDTELAVSPSVRRRADQSPSQVKYIRQRTVQPNLFSENLLKSGNFSGFWDSLISEVSL